LKRALKLYIKAVYFFAHKCGLFGAAVMVGLMLLTVADVVLRSLFRAPILGSFELTEFALVVMAFLAIPWAAVKKANVRVDLLVSSLTPKMQAVFDSVTCFMALVVTAFCAWYTVPQALYIWRLGTESDMLRIPVYPFYFLVAFGFFLLSLILLANFIELVKKAVKG
jgi:TRAP-type C4-dicarboxylate transport system permease small subunit